MRNKKIGKALGKKGDGGKGGEGRKNVRRCEKC